MLPLAALLLLLSQPCLVVGLSPLIAQEPQPRSDPSGNWTPYLPLTDEFDSDSGLNASNWVNAPVSNWRGRQPGLFDPSNAFVAGGSLQLWARGAHRNASWPAGYDNFTTSYIESVNRTAGGYFEVSSRSGNSSISSSFWLHYNDGAGTWTEIDVFESVGSQCPHCQYNMSSRLMCSHTHIFSLAGVPIADVPALCGCTLSGQDGMQICSSGSCAPVPFSFDGAFHTLGLDWGASTANMYADGILVNSLNATCLQQPLGVNLDRETMPGWLNLPDEPFVADAPFEIDYLRVWKRPSAGRS